MRVSKRIFALIIVVITGVHMAFSPCVALLSRADENTVHSYSVGEYNLIFDDAGVVPNSVRDRIGETFRTVYPIMAERYNKSAPKTVYLDIRTSGDGVAYASGNRITLFANWITDNPSDTDCITHELFHVVQSYPGYPEEHIWAIEGITDYARYKFGLYNDKQGWGLPNYNSGQNYTNSYGVAARFFVWLEQKKMADLVPKMDVILRRGDYTNESWVEVTGKTVDELWAEYAANPSVLPASAVISDIHYTLPYKTVYNVWETLDLSGLNVVKLMQDGTVWRVEDYTVSGYDPVPGDCRISVRYGDFVKRFFVQIADEPPRGDVNGDGRQNLQDIMKMRNFILKAEQPTAKQAYFADMNGDNLINAVDVLRLRDKILHVKK